MDKCIVLFEGEKFDKHWPPEEPEAFMKWWAEKLTLIPAEFRASAKVEICSRVEYDSDCPTISISYWRPETGAEANERETKARQNLADRAAMLRRELEQLERRS